MYKVNGFNESLNVSGNFSLDDVVSESLVKDLLLERVRFYLNESYFTRAISSGVDRGSFNWVMSVKPGDLVAQPTLPQSFFNTNHIANRYTISKIDFDNYNISLNPYYLV